MSEFQSTLPLRGATVARPSMTCSAFIFQSTLPLRGATTANDALALDNNISIHTPLAGSDPAMGHGGWQGI